VPRQRVHAYVYRGYWEDVGPSRPTSRPTWRCCQPIPPFDFYDGARPVYTNPRFLPASKLEHCTVPQRPHLRGLSSARSGHRPRVIGIAAASARTARIRNSLLIGADSYETLDEMRASQAQGIPPVGIGSDSIIEGAIIDKNARIGRGVHIVNQAGVKEKDGDGYFIREGIVVVPRMVSSPTAASSREAHTMFRFGVFSTSHFALTRMIPSMLAGRDISVAAIASRDGKRAAQAARSLGVPKSYDSYEALLADPDVDAVYNPLPTICMCHGRSARLRPASMSCAKSQSRSTLHKPAR